MKEWGREVLPEVMARAAEVMARVVEAMDLAVEVTAMGVEEMAVVGGVMAMAVVP